MCCCTNRCLYVVQSISSRTKHTTNRYYGHKGHVGGNVSVLQSKCLLDHKNPLSPHLGIAFDNSCTFDEIQSDKDAHFTRLEETVKRKHVKLTFLSCLIFLILYLFSFKEWANAFRETPIESASFCWNVVHTTSPTRHTIWYIAVLIIGHKYFVAHTMS